jgi:predicted PurR-regulated permease PerM
MSRKPSSKSSSSRWWYGVAFFIGVLGVVWASYGILHLVSEPQVGSPPTLVPSSPETGLVFLFSLLTVAATVLIGSLLAPLYSLCLYLDVRALRQNNSNWIPNRVLWGAVAILHLGSFVFSAVQLITIPAGVVYLYKRHKEIGLR